MAELAHLRAPRHDGWTPQRQADFLDALVETGSVAAAARHVGMATSSAYRLRARADAAGFRAAWDAATAHVAHMLEDAMLNRAIDGVVQPVFQGGKRVGERVVHHDKLAMYMLDRAMPRRARLHTGNDFKVSMQPIAVPATADALGTALAVIPES